MAVQPDAAFWVRVKPEGDCHVWTGGKTVKGYGLFRGTGAHRVALAHALGRDIKPGMYVCHRCDNPPCVNPDHLFEGTQKDNMQDAKRKGRVSTTHVRSGEESAASRLTWREVRDIRALRARGWRQASLAETFGVGQQHISRVVRGVVWKDAA